MQREGSLDAPTRLPIDWQDKDFLDKDLLDQEMSRQFDVCHGCRRCFNLCGSFPKLFDLIDDSETGEVDSLNPEDFGSVVGDCTLCDMCYMTKCPYVPPHAFNIDFPHLMLRYKAYQYETKQNSFVQSQMTEVDRNAKVLSPLSSIVNAATKNTSLLRPLVEIITNIDKRASVPQFAGTTLLNCLKKHPINMNTSGVAIGEKAVLYATCYGNYHETEIGYAAIKILRHLGVDVTLEYPGCCGMPQLESGNIKAVASKAENVSAFFSSHIDDGRTVLALVPSCALMLKSEWPLIYPENETILKLQKNTRDIVEYIVILLKKYEASISLLPLSQKVFAHIACHARAQNMGNKAAELLSYIPEIDVKVIERCSGHGGTWGMMKEHFSTALKVGLPVVKVMQTSEESVFVSECPLAAEHIHQGLQLHNSPTNVFPIKSHPLLILQASLGLE